MVKKRRVSQLKRRIPSLPVTIYAIADTHVSFTDGSWSADTETRLDRMKRFVELVNNDKPDLVVHLGDAVEDEVDWDSFLPEWEKIEPKKLFIAGNHDFANERSFEDVAIKFGYDDRESVSGNKFNYAFEMGEGSTRFKIINLDTNANYTWAGSLDQDRLDWVEQQLVNTDREFVLLMAHAAPHNYPDTYFIESSAYALKDVVDYAYHQNPRLKQVYGLHGHRHPSIGTNESNIFGNQFKGLICKANTDNTSAYVKLTVHNGEISWQELEIQ